MSGKIHRLKKESDFVTLDNHALRNKELSWKGKGLHCYLMHLPDDWQINIADLQNRSDDGRDSTAAGLRELINTGYVTRTRVVDDNTKQFIGYDYNVYERPEYAIAENGKPVNGFSVNGEAENGKPVTNKNRYKVILKEGNINEEINTPVSEKETFVTTFTPDQIEKEKLAVTVVEGGTFSFDAADCGKDIPGGPGEKTPALQNAGTLKAECFSNNPPPIFFNPELQRRYNGTAPTNGKARKTPAQDRTAQICAELTSPEMLAFFHAITADWQRWTDYKRREKKGSYKSAETEAVAIGQLYKKVGGDPAAARDAIEHSIAQTYMGIYPPKDAKPTAEPCARYSMQDGPRATTSEEMTLEISRFYNANKDKYTSLLRHPGMERYTVPKLKEAVSLFCASRIKQNRGGETFQQQHAALEQHFLFLIKREREDAAKQAGPQSYNPADLRAAEKIGR